VRFIATPSAPTRSVVAPERVVNIRPEYFLRPLAEPTTQTVVDRDMVLDELTSASFARDASLHVELNREFASGLIQLESSNPAVATISPDGVLAYVSPGVTTVTATIRGQTFAKEFVVATSGGGTIQKFNAWVEGSWGKVLHDAIQSRIEGKDAAANNEEALKIFSVQDHAAGVYVRNPNCWAADIDLTALSPWSSDQGPRKAGTLVAPDVILFAAHYQLAVGATVRFVTLDNQVIARTIVGRAAHPDYDPNGSYPYPDLAVARLNEDVPASIRFAKILPANWSDHLIISTTGSQRRIPGILLDQHERATVADTGGIGVFTGFWTAMTNPHRATFNRPKVVGDSGDPGLLTDGVDLFLETVWTHGGFGPMGAGIAYHADGINSAMTALGSPYQLTPADLSGLPTYVATNSHFP
jgi:hypothetical protein